MSPTDVHCLPRSSNQNGRHSSTQPFGPLPGLLRKAGNGGVGELMPLLGTTRLKGIRTKTSAAEFQPASWTLSNPPLITTSAHHDHREAVSRIRICRNRFAGHPLLLSKFYPEKHLHDLQQVGPSPSFNLWTDGFGDSGEILEVKAYLQMSILI